jgi:hypothetical protein
MALSVHETLCGSDNLNRLATPKRAQGRCAAKAALARVEELQLTSRRQRR